MPRGRLNTCRLHGTLNRSFDSKATRLNLIPVEASEFVPLDRTGNFSPHLTIQIGSADGVAHHFVFAPRRLTSRGGATDAAQLKLCFANARQGWTVLLHPHAIGQIVECLLTGGAVYQGNASLVLWFYGLTRFVLPIGRSRPLRKALPDAYIAPDPGSAVASLITREPAVDALDPEWKAAHVQRAKMAIVRGSTGKPFPIF